MDMTVSKLDESYIKQGSLRALFEGSELTTRSDLLTMLAAIWDLPYSALPTRYSFERYLDMVKWLRQQLYSTESAEKGYEKLGRNITKGFFLGMTGQVLKITMNVMGIQRSVGYFFRVAGGALPFGEFKVVEEKPGYVRAILYNVPGSPELMRGMALESMNIAKAINPQVAYHKLNALDTEFIARWES